MLSICRLISPDSKTSHIEELSETFGNVRGNFPEEEDFDSLLRKCQEELRSGECS